MTSVNLSSLPVPAGQAAGQPNPSNSLHARRSGQSLLLIAIALLLLAPVAQKASIAQALAIDPAYVELNAQQLDQLVAPIALDPDPLVAQILTSSTFPDQVADADQWMNQNLALTPMKRASVANGMTWDPSIKGLVEFPIILDSTAKNTAWTTQLGNAYYNQPDDVMNAIQALRLEAQQANLLLETRFEKVVVTADVIEILPVDTTVVYLPYYNPWHIWTAEFTAYPGFVELPPPAGIDLAAVVAFEPAINVGAFAPFDWGVSAWAPSWSDGSIQFNHNPYVSNSGTVDNHGRFGTHDRGVFERAGRGVPRGFRPVARPLPARFSGRPIHNQPGMQRLGTARPGPAGRFNPRAQAMSKGFGPSSRRNYGSSLTRTSNALHPNQVGRPSTQNHSNAMNAGSRNFGRPTAGTHAPTSARFSTPGRPSPMGHTPAANRTAPRPAMPSSNGMNRSMAANHPMTHPAAQNRNVGFTPSRAPMNGMNRPMSQPASTGNNLGGNRPVGHAASLASSFGPSRAMTGGASMGHMGNAGHAPMPSGRKR